MQVCFKNRRAKYRKKQRAIKTKTKDNSGNTNTTTTTTNSSSNNNTTSASTTTKSSTDTTTTKSTSASSSDATENSTAEDALSGGSPSSLKADGDLEDSKEHFRSPTPESEDSAMESDTGEDNSSAVDVESLDVGAETERAEKRVECDSVSEVAEHAITTKGDGANGRLEDKKSEMGKDHNGKYLVCMSNRECFVRTDRIHTHTHTHARTNARARMHAHTHTPVSYTHLTLPTRR